MDDTRQVTTPEEMHSELRETRKETAAEAQAAMDEEKSDLEKEATVRAGVQVEEAEMWGGVNTDEDKIQEVLTRGVADVVVREELEKKLRSGRKLRVKLGIDPTGPLLHIGRAVTLLKLRQFQELGHQIVLIIGDFTALVGDASDKDSQRPMLSREQIEKNMETYKEQIGRILDLSKVEFRYNSEWLRPLNFNDVIRLASQFTVAQMIQRENFSDRWDQGKPIGLHELLYPLMQGFDSVAIEADLEIGGTDQLFNLMAGRALQQNFGQPPQSVLTMNMIPGTDGRKMSTSWGNAIWLLDDPKDQFGKIMSMGDAVIPTYLESSTRAPVDEVRRIERGLEDGSVHPMDAKKRLGWEIVKMYHGEDAANRAKEDFERQFQNRELPTEIPVVPIDKVGQISAQLNPVQLSGHGEITVSGSAHLTVRSNVVDLLLKTGLAPSRKQAVRLIEQGGVQVDGERITSREQNIDVEPGTIIKVGRSYVKIVE